MKPTTISVIGLGYMGLPMALILANQKHSVVGIDTNSSKLNQIQTGKCPFDEPGVPKLLKKVHNTKFFQTAAKPTPSEIFLICVPTPHKKHHFDTSYLTKALESILPVLENNNLVIIESTIPPTTSAKLIKPLLDKSKKKYHLIHCPERAMPGRTLHEIIHNDRVIGALTSKSAQLAKNFYSSFIKGKIHLTDLKTAETTKVIENTFRDVNIALANEFAKIARDLKVDIWEVIALANNHPRVNILSPGPGVGGHCIAVDPWFLIESSPNTKLITLARETNDSMSQEIIKLLKQAIKETATTSPKIGILGAAYKKNVDDSRETPANQLIKSLKQKKFPFQITDPFVKTFTPALTPQEKLLSFANILILVTDHDIYKKIDFRRYPNIKAIIDTRNLFAKSPLPLIKLFKLGGHKEE